MMSIVYARSKPGAWKLITRRRRQSRKSRFQPRGTSTTSSTDSSCQCSLRRHQFYDLERSEICLIQCDGACWMTLVAALRTFIDATKFRSGKMERELSLSIGLNDPRVGDLAVLGRIRLFLGHGSQSAWVDRVREQSRCVSSSVTSESVSNQGSHVGKGLD